MKTIHPVLGVLLGAAALLAPGCNKSEEEMLAETKAFLNAGGHVDDFEWPGTRLHVAAKKGYKTVARLLVHYGADVNAPGYIGWFTSGKMIPFGGLTPLHDVIRRGSLPLAEALLAAGADTDAPDDYGSTSLHVAARHGRESMVSALLAAGADINAASAFGSRPLHEAAFVGRPSLVNLLLNHGANVQVTNARGQSPIDLAQAKGNTLAALILSSSLAQTEALARRPSPVSGHSGSFDLP